MHVERLLDLAEKLKTVPRHKFNLHHFVKRCVYPEELSTKEQLLKLDCGTTACAVGYLPIFYPDVFEYLDVHICYITEDITIDCSDFFNTSSICSADYFSLNEEQWYYLFEYDSYNEMDNPLLVVEHIHKLVKEWKD